MKSVLISIKPKWIEKIVNGEKTIEVRKTRPKIETPFKCYIYCTYGQENENYMLGKRGKVIGEFICDKVYSIKNQGNSFVVANEEQGVTNEIARQSCLDYDDMVGCLGNKDGYGLHITALKIYDKPKELGEFIKPCPYGDLPCSICPSCDKDKNDNLIQCFNTVSRPPQSWCYVEEL